MLNAVRMNPYGVTNCTAGETQVSWPGMDTTGLHDVYQESATSTARAFATHQVVRNCDAGDITISGGYYSSTFDQLTILASHPTALGDGWNIIVRNPAAMAADFDVFLVCATLWRRLSL